jgi:acetyltransferase-like isoleucine patch superfamily enzyme
MVNGGHRVEDLQPFSGPQKIGRGCWLGMASRIVGPIVVGDAVVVGAGSVVVDDLPFGCVAAGAPARVIRQRQLSPRQWHFRNVYFQTDTFEST